tara:strand:+ start:1042 stop:1218 length:177 start_codon:yes stop_codon:yes gene_type:complete
MKSGDTEYIGDGAYLRWTGYSFEFLANDHEHPTDTVVIENHLASTVIRLMQETLNGED